MESPTKRKLAAILMADAVGYSRLMVNAQWATERDLQELGLRLESGMRELELRLKHDLTLRLGAMMATGIAIVPVLVRFL